ncbi:RHS repeat-associated core domain-containing protein [Micromonospora sp. NPDC048947]|uniref:RHS repeat-associated core domain-containing protein n=1 Tax=Micromonospora sp. NPDC048947 TaxID=3154826 RepID=UPI0033C65B10
MRKLSWGGVVLLAASTVLAAPVAAPAAAKPVPGPGRTKAVAPAQPGSPASGDTIALGPSRGTVALLAGPVSTPKGTGPERNATFTSFDLTDRVKLQVNAGSGNLLFRTTDLVLPGIKDNLVLGAAYNSLLVGGDIEIGAFGRGWLSRSGADIKLIKADDNSLTYVAADGVVGRFTVNGNGYNTPNQFKGTMAKDGDGWKFTENEGGRELYFTSAGLLDRTEDRDNNVTDYTYTAAGSLTKVVSDRGSTGAKTVTVTYANGRISRFQQSIDASNAREVRYQYNNKSNLTAIVPSSGHAVRFTYDSSQRVKKIVTGFDSEPGTETRIDYDSQHRVAAVTRVLQNESADNPDGRLSVTRWAYTSSTETQLADANTDLTKPVPSVPRTTYTINDEKRVTKAVDPAGKERSKEYTQYNDVKSSTDGMGKTTTSSYGANSGQSLTATSSPTGAGASASYGNAATPSNPTGNFQPSSTTDAQKNQTTYTYNGAGNQTSAKDAEAAQADVDYNSDGTVKTSTDPTNKSSNNATRYTYYGDKQLQTITPPTGNSLGARDFTYDAFGRIRTQTDGAGNTQTLEYDSDDRTVKISYSDGRSPVEFQYDGAGNTTYRSDAESDETFVYDRMNRLIQRGDEYSPVQYTYDPVGNLTRLHGDWRGDTDYTYDNRNLLTKMVVDDDTEYTFSYDDEGRRTDSKMAGIWSAPDTVAATHNTYDDSGRLTRTTSKRWQKVNNADQETVVYDVSYCYAKRVGTASCSTAKTDDTGLRQWETQHHRGGTVQVYTYDKANRLTKATDTASGTYDYAYDSNGNRTSVKTNGTETQKLTYNSANQINTSGYTYDGAGNQLNGSGMKSAVYNAAGQTAENTQGPKEFSLSYLGPDQMQLDSAVDYNDEENGDYYYEWGRDDQHSVPMVEDYQVPSYDHHFLERDADGTLIGLRVNTKKDDAWSSYFAVLDGLGSVVAMISEDGSLAGTYTYDPWGRTTATVANEPFINELAVGYASGLKVGSLIKFGKRWYDPATGRFTQQDSLNRIGDPAHGNRYAYAGDNPTNNLDPTGMSALGDFMGHVDGFMGFGAVVGTIGGCALGALAFGVGCLAGAEVGAMIGGVIGLGVGMIDYGLNEV